MAMKRKYRGKVQLTAEYLRDLLKLPKEVEIHSMEYNANRDILSVYFASDNIIDGVTHRIEEGTEHPVVDLHRFHKKG